MQPRFQITELVKLYAGKWLVLGGSIDNLRQMQEALEEDGVSCKMLCRENVDEEEEVVMRITCCEDFQQRVLLASKVIDTGINIVDREVKNILLLCKTKESAMQMLGRKRKLEGEKVNVFVVCERKKTFDDLLYKKAQIRNTYIQMGEQENYFEAVMAGKLNLIHLREITYIKEGGLRVNTLAIEQLLYEMEVFDEARKAIALDERAWGLAQASWFGKRIEELTTLGENIKEESKAKVLAWIENCMLSKDAVPKEEIKSWINDDSIVCWIKVLLQKKCEVVSVEALNKVLEAEGIVYQINIVGKREVNNSQINIYKFEKTEIEQK